MIRSKFSAVLLAAMLPTTTLAFPSVTALASEESTSSEVPSAEASSNEASTEISTELSDEDSKASSGYQIGDQMPDFSVTTPDGEKITLSDLLKDHNTVVLNLWFAGCSPCELEFPYLEEAYQKYSDKVAVVALTPYDEDDAITKYKESHSLTFPMAKDTAGLTENFNIDGFPTTIIIDRFGTICFRETGSQPSTNAFESMFEAFSADDYTESLLDFTIPRVKPDCTMPDADKMNAALNIENADTPLTFFAMEDDEYAWPWLLNTEEASNTEDNDRTYAYAGNTGVDNSYAQLCTTVSAKAGDVLAFDYKISCESVYDYFTLSVNKDVVKTLTGDHDWASYAYRFEKDGDYDIVFTYNKDEMGSAGDDLAAIDNVALLSGEAADEAVLKNPVYPTAENADDITITPASDSLKEVVFYDNEDGTASTDLTAALDDIFAPGTKCYLSTTDTADFSILLGNKYDPDAASVFSNFDGSQVALSELDFDDNGFQFSTGIDSTLTSGYTWSALILYPDILDDSKEALVGLFASEEDLNAFVQNEVADLDGNPIEGVKWKYADGTLPSTDALPSTEDSSETSEVSYKLVFTDQDGNGVAGVVANVCDEDTCQPRVADDNGIIEFDAAAYPYAIHVLSVPEGYEFDTTQEFTAPEDGGTMEFTITKK